MSAGPAAPLVSVGMPVHNEERTLETAVYALLHQTYPTLEIIISDNASSDGTRAIGERLALSDDRVRYSRRPENQGPDSNFRYVLENARGTYFMWAGADDIWQPTYIEKNLARLEENPDLVCSISQVGWGIDGEGGGLAAGTASLEGSVRSNVKRYLRNGRDNSRFYGLFVREALVASYPSDTFYGLDLAMMLGTLMLGKHAELDEVLMTRTRTDPMSYISHVDEWNRPGVERWMPLLPFTRYVLLDLRIPLTPVSLALLVIRNVYEHLRYAALHDTVYGAISRVIVRAVQPARTRLVSSGA